jgi:co-chaperonin GroES (HSP10)
MLINDNTQVTNDTGFQPAPGYILAEIFIPDTVSGIVLPHKVKDERQPELEKVIVLEHTPSADSFFEDGLRPGTRILVKGGGLFNIVPGRKLTLVDEQDLLGVYE